MMVGTFQISDDSLELMGYDKSKKWSEQSDRAQYNVAVVYGEMVKNALRKPDYYGRMMTATMHVDESTPHVDFMCIGVDPERLNFGVSEILNGETTKDPKTGKRRNKPKGMKLAEIQDDLSTIYGHNPEVAKKFDLVRGNKISENLANVRNLRAQINNLVRYEAGLERREDELDEREKRLTEKELKLASKKAEIDSHEVQLEETEKRLDEREQALNRRESTLNDKDKALSGLKSRVESLESENSALRERVIRFEGRYEYDKSAKTAQHMFYRTEYLKERAQKRPQTPRQQTKDYGYGR